MAEIESNYSYPKKNPPESGKPSNAPQAFRQASLFLQDVCNNVDGKREKANIESLFTRFDTNGDGYLNEKDGNDAVNQFSSIYEKYFIKESAQVNEKCLEQTNNPDVFYDTESEVFVFKKGNQYEVLGDVTHMVYHSPNKTIVRTSQGYRSLSSGGKVKDLGAYSQARITQLYIQKKCQTTNEQGVYIDDKGKLIRYDGKSSDFTEINGMKLDKDGNTYTIRDGKFFVNGAENSEMTQVEFNEIMYPELKSSKADGIYVDDKNFKFYRFDENTLEMNEISENVNIDNSGNIGIIKDGKFYINGVEKPDMTQQEYDEQFGYIMAATCTRAGQFNEGDKVYQVGDTLYTNGKEIPMKSLDFRVLNQNLTYDPEQNLYFSEVNGTREYKKDDGQVFLDVPSEELTQHFNGKLEYFEQDRLGECYLLASLRYLKETNPEAVGNLLEPHKDKDGNVTSMTVHLHYMDKAGKNYPFNRTYTPAQVDEFLKDYPELADGDKDVNAVEIAYNELRKFIKDNRWQLNLAPFQGFKSDYNYGPDMLLEGGQAHQALFALTGKVPKTFHYSSFDGDFYKGYVKRPSSDKQQDLEELLKNHKSVYVAYKVEDGFHASVITGIKDGYVELKNTFNATKRQGVGDDFIEKIPVKDFMERVRNYTFFD